MAERTAVFAGGPFATLSFGREELQGAQDEGVGGASRQGATPSFETHKDDLSALSTVESRPAWWRTRAARALAAVTFGVAGVTSLAACGGSNSNGIQVVAPSVPGERPAPTPDTAGHADAANFETSNPSCNEAFTNLNATEQEQCRQLIAGMEMTDIQKLEGVDFVRWQSYYRHAALGETSPLFNVIPTRAWDDPAGSQMAVNTLALDFMQNTFTLAWLEQQQPALAKDERTRWALFGHGATETTPGAKIADAVAQQMPAGNLTLQEYIRQTMTSSHIMASPTAEQVHIIKKSDGTYDVHFSIRLNEMGELPNQTVGFSYKTMPYPNGYSDSVGRETVRNPNDPLQRAQDEPTLSEVKTVTAIA